MKKFIKFLLDKASKFDMLDYGMFKVCLFTLGLIFGAYYAAFFLKWMPIVWVLFIVSYLFIMYKIFVKK